ncbi:ferritin-like domain-containing protein [Hymenobacter lutimineralis]|uniref:Ferritin-like domain-containing protein n=1 Tax=Hymenobacter lutimineralis TaxID=2606448 RepID=A0A5D6V2R0_9BACT|nr:ferritin-like domain-containing protein [Hymenobacter lutimineralis]TYZ09607.1 ferritin-like domain-containing protein [Hymenobacter lutimineralis]
MSDSVVTKFLTRSLHRRSFFRIGGAVAAATTLTLAGCGDDPVAPTGSSVLSLGQADAGLLNYIYVLEQLEAAFYQQVLAAAPADMSTEDKDLLTQIYQHEVVHRELLLQALSVTGAGALSNLEFTFASLSLSSRSGVLTAARMFEDLIVAAYNGAAPLFADGTYLLLLGKIVSVEARHAALVHDLLQAGSFADNSVVEASGTFAGLERTLTVTEVITELNKYLVIKVSADNLPTA